MANPVASAKLVPIDFRDPSLVVAAPWHRPEVSKKLLLLLSEDLAALT